MTAHPILDYFGLSSRFDVRAGATLTSERRTKAQVIDHALRELGLSVPGDVAVVGYDNRETASYMHPPLTTVVLPHFEMGATAVQTLIDLAARPSRRPPQIEEEGPLVDRQSV